MNDTLVKIALALKQGKTLQAVAEEMGVEKEWVEQVTGTNGFLVVKEAVDKGEDV